jgi:hypothetical protein
LRTVLIALFGAATHETAILSHVSRFAVCTGKLADSHAFFGSDLSDIAGF